MHQIINNQEYITAFGEIMLRLKAKEGLRFTQNPNFELSIAGAETNTLVLLQRLGFDTQIVSALPNHLLADFAIESLQQQNVETKHILRYGDKMGNYFVEDGNNIRRTQVIYDRKNTSFSELNAKSINWIDILMNSYHFHFTGIATAISQSAMECCQTAIEFCDQLKIPISCDFNYRNSLWYYNEPDKIMPKLIHSCQIIIADFDALYKYLKIETNEKDSLEKRFQFAFKKLQKYAPKLEFFAMTFREVNEHSIFYYGALATPDGFYFSPHYELKNVIDPIGAGDAFCAGILEGILNKQNSQNIIQRAVACSILKQSIKGDWALINNNEIDYFIQNGITSKINR